MPRTDGVKIITYADNITIAAQASLTIKEGKLLKEATEMVVNWLTNLGLMALMKMELIFLQKEGHITS